MPRSRNVKPGLFKNEILGEADPLITILFIGLWCLADKAGRLEDRPKRIKAEIFPYREEPDINGYLTELERMGFLTRYEVAGERYIEVKNFSKHQSPHKTEKDSEIPEPLQESDTCEATVKEPLSNESVTVKESLIPDSLIPDSLIPDCGKKRAHALPKDFTPQDSHRELAKKHGVDLDAELPQFRDHHEARGTTMKNWDSALNTWIRNAAKFAGKGKKAAQPLAEKTYTGTPEEDIAWLKH